MEPRDLATGFGVSCQLVRRDGEVLGFVAATKFLGKASSWDSTVKLGDCFHGLAPVLSLKSDSHFVHDGEVDSHVAVNQRVVSGRAQFKREGRGVSPCKQNVVLGHHLVVVHKVNASLFW